MALNLFDKAKVLETKPTAGKKVKSRTLIEGLEVFAAVDHVAKWLKTLAETVKPMEAISEVFIAEGIAKKAKPANFDAEEGNATGNVQCKKRSSASGLNDIEKELAATYNVPTEVVADRPRTFIVNPERLEWLEKNQDKISTYFTKLGAPEDIFQYQDATTKTVTTDDSIDFVFRTYAKKPEVIAQLLPVVATLAIKPKYDAGDDTANSNALAVIKQFLGE